MKVRVTYGIDKVLEGASYHEKHIIDDLLALSAPETPLPAIGIPATTTKGVDTEYDAEGKLLTVGFSSEKLRIGLEVIGGTKPVINRALRETSWLVGHNIPGDIDKLLENGYSLTEEWLQGRKILDTLVLAKMLDENKPRGSYGLEPLTLTNYNMQPWKAATDARFVETKDAADWSPDERETRCGLDAWATFMLAKKFHPQVATDKRAKLLIETLHRISMTLYRIGLAGAKVDREYLTQFNAINTRLAREFELVLVADANGAGWDKPEPFSPTKDADIRHLLFNLLGLKSSHKTQNGLPAVDKISLREHLDSNPAIIKPLLEYNKLQKLASGYENTDEMIDKNGLLHMWINQLGARTGRRSSGGGTEGTPNSKNWQNATPSAKQMIVSRFYGGKIGAFDYKSLEPILLAWIAKDAKLYDFFYKGNGYIDVGKEIGIDVDKNDPKSPYRAIKSMTLGIFYNMQAKLMANNLWRGVGMDAPYKFSESYAEHVDITTDIRYKIVGAFKGLQRYWEKQKLAVEADGQIVAPDGYIRHLPHHGPSTQGYWKLVNQGINFPIQHLASMVTGCALVDCEEAMLKIEKVSYWDYQRAMHNVFMPSFSVLINEVHDELTWDLHPDTIDRDKEMILDTMSRPPSLIKLIPDFNIKLKIESIISDRWGQKA